MTANKNSNILCQKLGVQPYSIVVLVRVCDKEWLNQYISNLPEHQKQNIKYINEKKQKWK